ncbi:MAG: hypothetical protein JJU36_14290 [Phycisphaeraceae bacterium]|nr:hypothetical protein [Phycisphaeraceae bacterium]
MNRFGVRLRNMARPARRSAAIGLVLPVLICVGCSTGMGLDRLPGSAAIENQRVHLDASDYHIAFQSALEVLRDFGFGINRQDAAMGRITTRPLPADTLIELGRTTPVDGSLVIASSINAQRIVVEVQFDALHPIQEGGMDDQTAESWRYEMRVEVHVFRHQSPGAYGTGSSRPRFILNQPEQTPLELQERGIHGHRWQPIGRSTRLEQAIRDAILRAWARTHTIAEMD